MTPLNPLLGRQLRRLGLSEDAPPTALDGWSGLLERVSRAYDDADRERYTTERAFSVSSREMKELYDRLKERSRDEVQRERDKLANAVALQTAAFDTMTEGVLVVDAERRVQSFNRAFTRIWRVPEEVARSGDDQAVLASGLAMVADVAGFVAKVQYLYEHPDEPSHDEVSFIDGRVLDRYSAPVRAPDGTVRARLWIFREITAQRRAEEAERDARSFVDSIVENIPHMIFVKEAASLRLIRFNRAGEELLGVSRDALIGKNDHDLLPRERADHFTEVDRRVLASGQIEIQDEPIETASGPRLLHTKKIPICDDNGVARFLLGISRDITDEKRSAEALRRSKEEAETASRAKTEFLANMSHELRTPLNSIVGFARVLDGELGVRQREYLRYILVAGEHMLALVNDLLDLRRVEENRRPLDLAQHEARTLIDAAVGMVKPLVDERRHTLTVVVTPAADRVRCDARALVQVLVNLLSNAAKYTEPGGQILLGVGAADGSVVVEVADTGVGIAPDDQAKLFTYFTQVGAKHQHHMRGSGVGLALTRALVEAMGGSVRVSSAPGSGSSFLVTLPSGEPELVARPG